MEDKMKHLLVLILTSLFLVSSASADVKVLFKHSRDDNLPYHLRTLCIDGYKWVHTGRIIEKDGVSLATTMNQFMIEKDGHAVPAKC